jgi:hypothetical protein
MPASYPTSIKSFTTKGADQAIQPGHVNDLQDEVTAIETDLLKNWSSWSPTWTNLTVGDGTVTAKYFKIGKLVFFELHLVLGATSSIGGAVSVDLPVNAAATTSFIVGHGEASDANGLRYSVFSRLTGADAQALYAHDGTSMVPVNTTAPHVWASTDGLALTGFYEAAA